jgi:transcriptional regulator with XRE-family HTH domain
MINAEQIRAARALLDWSTSDLAKQAGLTINGINKIERGHVQAHRETLETIEKIFDDAGIEFLPGSGLRKKNELVEFYEGKERFDAFYDFIYENLKQHGGGVCLNIYDESVLVRYRKDPALHRHRMKELVDRGNVSFRILTTKSDFVSYGYAQFKWQPNRPPTPSGFYAFGNCLALMSFVNAQSPHVIVIQSNPLVEAYRQDFEIAWDNAQSPPIPGKPPSAQGGTR